jgi:hypothetical protein
MAPDPHHRSHGDPPEALDPPDPALDDELRATEGALAEDLRALLTPGAGMGRRTADSVDRTLRARSTGATALELLGTGWRTLSLLVSPVDEGGRP